MASDGQTFLTPDPESTYEQVIGEMADRDEIVIRYDGPVTEFTCAFDGITYGGHDEIDRMGRLLFRGSTLFVCGNCIQFLQNLFALTDESGPV